MTGVLLTPGALYEWSSKDIRSWVGFFKLNDGIAESNVSASPSNGTVILYLGWRMNRITEYLFLINDQKYVVYNDSVVYGLKEL